jgi:radical SAM superfamily enzyme YgiQ (UPF0313 family)
MSIQTSRGCPFSCEFCDIIEIFGRVPRVKKPEQVVAELESLRRLGYRGEVFVVDDNFIGNKKAVRGILAEIASWQNEAGYPFALYTEASLNLAEDDRLIEAMRAANFTSVFIGIETPDPEALKRTKKGQNVGVDLPQALDKLTRAGLEVMAGFIVGFDGDRSEAFEAQRELLRDAPLPLAMTGLLTALPGTALWRRLQGENRLRDHSDGDAFARPNFDPTMPERELLEGYAWLLSELYSAEAYYARSRALVERLGAPVSGTPLLRDDVEIALRALVRLGVLGERRGLFWQLVAAAAPQGLHAVRAAIASAIRGEHMIRYTQEVVLPRLAEAVAKLPAEAAPAAQPRRRVALRVLPDAPDAGLVERTSS